LGASSTVTTNTATTSVTASQATAVTTSGSTLYATSVLASGSSFIFSSVTSTSTTTVTQYSTSYSTTLLTSAVSTAALTSTQTTTYGMSAFGAISTYGVILIQKVRQVIPQETTDVTWTYTNSLYVNGTATASTAANFTNPTGYWLSSVQGFGTPTGFCLLEYFTSTTSGAAMAVYSDSYYYNGTEVATASSLGTYIDAPQGFVDATGSIWIGYTVNDYADAYVAANDLYAAYAGEVLYQVLSANTLSSIFATLAIMIAALFAF